jgi:IS5 family transposase
VEYQVRDRLSFSRFLGLAIEDSIPDATTLWLFREKLAKAGLIEKLCDQFQTQTLLHRRSSAAVNCCNHWSQESFPFN